MSVLLDLRMISVSHNGSRVHSDKQITDIKSINMFRWSKYIIISFQGYSYIFYDNSGVLNKVLAYH